MGKRENKEIADKLDSLEGLPEGYEPNINSKWALVEEVLDEQKKTKRPGFIWMSIAAGLLLLISVSGVWIYLSSGDKVVISQKTPAKENNTVAVQNTSTAPVKNDRIVSIKHRTHKSSLTEIAWKKNNVSPKEEVSLALTEISLPTVDTAVNAVVHPITPLPVIAQAKPKARKSRYVQIDFNDTPIALKQLSRPDNFAQALHFNFMEAGNNHSSSGKATPPTNHLSVAFSPE
jgi:hypothetical protein